MEDGLVPKLWQKYQSVKTVLILVVVEDGLVLMEKLSYIVENDGLNPCCSGRWSRTVLSLFFSLCLIKS